LWLRLLHLLADKAVSAALTVFGGGAAPPPESLVELQPELPREPELEPAKLKRP